MPWTGDLGHVYIKKVDDSTEDGVLSDEDEIEPGIFDWQVIIGFMTKTMLIPPMKWNLTPQQVRKEEGTYKYVLLEDGTWRFCRVVVAMPRKHSEMVQPGEKPVAAGLIAVFEEYVKMYDSYSSTLRMGTSKEHWNALENQEQLRLNHPL